MALPDPLPATSGAILLRLARASIVHGLERGAPLTPECRDLPAALTVQRASFVTLQSRGHLRGCIGSLAPRRPLAVDVAANAYAAAFLDPRFPAVTRREVEQLTIHLSLLTVPLPLRFASEAELLALLHPGEDGLILQDGERCATFLPSVWDDLPTPELFLAHLKLKAGLPADYWSPRLRALRYATERIDEPETA